MEKQYKHLTLSERDMITTLLAENTSLREIARILGRDVSTISRELNRNASPEYRLYLSHRAQGRATSRRSTASRRPRLKQPEIRSYVLAQLTEGWSPEQIAGRLPLDHPGLSISPEAIYQYIYQAPAQERGELIRCLRRGHRRRKPRGQGRRERKTKIPGRIPIELRPASVEGRRVFGHWEGDSLLSRNSLVALNSLVERKSRLVLLSRLPRKSAQATQQAVIARLGALPPPARRTLTLDNGTENASHQELTAHLGLRCYFARPYASWQRGTCENTNGLVRWYLPKGTDFSTISDEQLRRIETLLNNRPRKCLGFKTPLEIATRYVALQG
jgi:transposase, IS30 family